MTKIRDAAPEEPEATQRNSGDIAQFHEQALEDTLAQFRKQYPNYADWQISLGHE